MTEERQRTKWRTLKQQNLPFEFFEEEERAKKEAENKKLENLPRFENPRNDNEKLLNWQWDYRHGDENALAKIYSLSKDICGKYVNVITHKNKKVKHLCEFDKEMKAQNAATYLVEQLMTRPGFAVREYVTAYLWLRVIKELFYHTKADEFIDYVDISEFYKEGTDDDN